MAGKPAPTPSQWLAWCRQKYRQLIDYLQPLGPGRQASTELQDEQARTLAATAFLFSALGINSIGLILLDFGTRAGLLGGSVGVLIVLLYAVWTVISLKRFRPDKKAFIQLSLAILVAQGVLWSVLINCISLVASSGQRNIITAIIMALVSVPMLGAPFAAAMAFWVPVVFGTVVAVAFRLQPFDDFMLLCFSGYLVFTLGGIVIINKTLLDRSMGRMRLLQQNQMVAVLLRDYEENTADWLWETDAYLRLRGVSARLAKLLAAPRESLEGKVFSDVLQLTAAGHEAGAQLAALLEARAAFRHFELEIALAGGTHWCCLTGRPVMDDSGQFTGYRGFGSDVTDARMSELRIRHLATHDSLTGLFNRSMFMDRLEQACKPTAAGIAPASFALLLLDLDRFKEVNDTYGHATGDALLVMVAERLRKAIRDCDVIARLGGDEFAIFVPTASVGYATDIATRLITLLSGGYKIEGIHVTIGASFGIAMFPQDGLTPLDLLRNVDLALYAAKEQERGTFQLFNAKMSELFFEQLELQSELRLAIGTNQLYIDYQPIVSLGSDRIVSVEALARWTHPVRGVISPAVFIRLAEEAGMISAIGEFVLREACKSAAGWPEDVCIAVNLSPVQFGNPNLPAMVAAALAESGLNPARLELEVTESTWLIASQQIVSHIEALQRAGVRMVLDDFGTGYSSLACLHDFHFQGVKIDKRFALGMEHDPRSLAIIRMIVRLAAELEVPLTVEGVETASQVALLRDCGIDRVQGFLFGRPQQAQDLFPAQPGLAPRAAMVRGG